MCFSATASFTAAGVTGVIGIISLTKAKAPRELPLAAVPLFFAIQQSIEGFLWLDLPTVHQGVIAASLTFGFLLFAEVLWPVYAPVTVWLIETDPRRRRFMLLWIAVGLGVSTYLLWWLLTHSHSSAIVQNHIEYSTEGRHSDALGVAYLAATCLPMLFSTRRSIILLGAVVLIGSLVAFILYYEVFVSVWCFFAAVASAVILYHFENERRDRIRLAAA